MGRNTAFMSSSSAAAAAAMTTTPLSSPSPTSSATPPSLYATQLTRSPSTPIARNAPMPPVVIMRKHHQQQYQHSQQHLYQQYHHNGYTHRQVPMRSRSLSLMPLTPPPTAYTPVYGSATTAAAALRFPANYQRSETIKLKKVLGLTVCSNAALDVSPISGLLAYPAGCTVVLFNAKRQTQAYLVNTARKVFTAVAFSRCGRYVATGEMGHNPAIKVWELDAPNGNLDQTTGGNVIAEFVDHKYAVTCVAFSPTGKYLVSVGSQHDMIVNVFDWKSNLKMASNKISSKVSALSFAEDGSYFVTVGNRHVKYWYLEGSRKYKDPIPLMGRSAILGDLRDNDFCAVACGKGVCSESTYAITRQGHLVEFSSRRLLDKWVACRTTNANCICVNGQYILVGCAESIIRIFNAGTLEYVTTLPRTHYLGVDVAQGIHINHIMNVPHNAKYPDCIAMVYDEQRAKVSCVYNDHSLYIWDMRDIRRVGKSHSFLYHSTCIWGVDTVPYNMEREQSHTLPEDCFVTCSSDDTIRVWGLEGCANNELYRKNIYSKELLKVIYIDDELSYIKDQETISDKSVSPCDSRNGVRCIKISPELQHLASGDRSGNIRVYNLATLKPITTIEAHESEVLCLEYSNDKIERKLLASASRDRLIHVFDVAQNYLLLQTLDDHSSSITSIKFVGMGLNFQMISCGADKSIMFRSFQGNIFLRGTHTSGKTTLYDMEVDSTAKHIMTACQDRNVRVYGTQNAKHTKTFKGSHSDEGSLVKLSLDPSGIYVATSCTDKTLAVYDYYSGDCMARMYGHSELVTGLKFTNDCRHLISASGDGCIFIWQVPHDMIITMQARLSQQRMRYGHGPARPRPMSAMLPTPEGIIVDSPTRELDDLAMLGHKRDSPASPLSPFGDDVGLTPGYKLADVGQLPQWAKRKATTPAEQDVGGAGGGGGGGAGGGGVGIPIPSTSSGTLSANPSMLNLSSSPSQLGVPRARGRWAQRGPFDPDTLTDLRSNSESPQGAVSSTTSGSATVVVVAGSGGGGVGGAVGSGLGMGNTQTSDYNSASSKDITYNQTYLSEDSSIDSGMETRRDLKYIGSNNMGTVPVVGANGNGPVTGSVSSTRLLPEKRKNGRRFDAQSNDNDGDIEDISDGERTSSDHGMFYNNIAPSTPTDFKVTAMNEDELRKSVRRQKFDKAGLTLSPQTPGTGTSDTEDEGSTPSAENADRSLASTLGGSSESIPQSTTTSFMQAALPDAPMVMERGSTSRRSISAKHNTENGKGGAVQQPTITKSYTSTKKEELLKVINEAKQKLENGPRKNGIKKLDAINEVGYRSLRGSHSISDLSLAGNLDNSRSAVAASRYAKTDAQYAEPIPLQYSSFYQQQPQPQQQQQQQQPPQTQQQLPPGTQLPTTISSSSTSPTPNYQQQQQQQYPYHYQYAMNQQQQQQHQQQYQHYGAYAPQQTQPHQQHFFNCAAPRSVMQQNCQAMRQVQQHYPPYPHHVGVHQIHPPPGVPFMAPATAAAAASGGARNATQQQQRSTAGRTYASGSCTLPNKQTQRGGGGGSGSVCGGVGTNERESSRVRRNPGGNLRRTPSILKHYKSCPVSPVHEEVEWSADNKAVVIAEPKRHSVYAEDARSILDMIHADTEKMIEEITRKYGDLDDISVDVYDASTGRRRVPYGVPLPPPPMESQTVPASMSHSPKGLSYMPLAATAHHHATAASASTMRPVSGPLMYLQQQQQQQHLGLGSAPKRAVSEYFIYQEFYQCRNVSLSDILNDEQSAEQRAEAMRLEDARFLETQRHSSASFFLSSSQQPGRCSQDSLLSGSEYMDGAGGGGGGDAGSYCNSMESVLSDESDCKSAPLEQMQRHAGIRNFIIHGPTSAPPQLISKSYGSSPNNGQYGSFDYYMQQQRNLHTSSPLPYESFDVTGYNLDNLRTTAAPAAPPTAPSKPLPGSKTYPRIAGIGAAASTGVKAIEDIPTLSSKNKQYNASVSKSLSQDFAQQRKTHPYEEAMFAKKTLKPKPPVPLKPQNLVSTLTSTMERKAATAAAAATTASSTSPCSSEATTPTNTRPPTTLPASKRPCAFDVDTTDLRPASGGSKRSGAGGGGSAAGASGGGGGKSRTASVVRKFERNLQKFEREKQAELQVKKRGGMRPSMSSGALTSAAATQSCLKKVSKFDGSSGSSGSAGAYDKNAAATRRATSMRAARSRPKISVRFNTVSQIKYTPSEKRSSSCSSGASGYSSTATLPLNDDEDDDDGDGDVDDDEDGGATTTTTPSSSAGEPDINRNTRRQRSAANANVDVGSSAAAVLDYAEKTFEMYIAENGNEEPEASMAMALAVSGGTELDDSLKLYTRPELQAVVDEIQLERERSQKHKKNLANEGRSASGSAADSSTSNQCKNIAQKIDIIHKLIEMEERKLEQIRLATETRMRPFACNSKQKGYVKSLTMNFDMLARGIERDIENEQRRMRGAAEGECGDDLCAYARHIKRNVSLPDVLESAEVLNHPYAFAARAVAQQQNNGGSSCGGGGGGGGGGGAIDGGVELAREVRADDEIDDLALESTYVASSSSRRDDDEKRDSNEKHSQGNPKSLLPMPIEESSIRRACSLSDLHIGNMGKGGKSNASSQNQKSGSVTYRNSSATRVASKRNSLQLKGSISNVNAPSTSMGVLNNSDSETEDTNRGRSSTSGSQGRTSNGPMAASRQYANKNGNVNNNRRKGPSNFNSAASLQDDSSSEETPGGSSGSKPAVPPRPRNLTFDHKSKATSVALNSSTATTSSGDPKSQVHNVINNLYTTTQTVVQLHANLRSSEDSLMLRELENAVIMTQNLLMNITQNKSDTANSQHGHVYTSTEQANLDNGDYLMMVNNCADLLSNCRLKHKSDDCENNS